MKVKKVDNDLYLDREVKYFFKDEEIPEKYKDATKFHLVIFPFNKRNEGGDSEKPIYKK